MWIFWIMSQDTYLGLLKQGQGLQMMWFLTSVDRKRQNITEMTRRRSNLSSTVIMGGAKDTNPKCMMLLSYAAYHHVSAGD